MKTPELKPCPVCGNTHLCYVRSLYFWSRWQVACGKCDYYGKTSFSEWLAVWLWNREKKEDDG